MLKQQKHKNMQTTPQNWKCYGIIWIAANKTDM